MLDWHPSAQIKMHNNASPSAPRPLLVRVATRAMASKVAVNRLRKEYKCFESPPFIRAAPLESNLQEWHYVLQGPPDSPYTGGLYHGKVKVPWLAAAHATTHRPRAHPLRAVLWARAESPSLPR